MRATVLFALSLLLKAVLCFREENDYCSEWRQEDSDLQDCRSCQAVTVDDEGNCPTRPGFECDAQQYLSSSVLTVDSCNCASIRCADRDWRLAVNGNIVDKITCKNKQWVTTQGDAVSSAVCAHEVPLCTVCNPNLIALSPDTADAFWNVQFVDAKCKQLMATCSGAAGVIAKVNGQSIAPDTSVVAECNADGTAWLYKGQVVQALDCELPGCLKCAGQVPIYTVEDYKVEFPIDTSTGCAVESVMCESPSGTGDVSVDFDGGVTTGPVASPSRFELTCSEDGTAWQFLGSTVTQGTCGPPASACQKCAANTFTTSGTGSTQLSPPDTSKPCATMKVECTGGLVQVIGGTISIRDGDAKDIGPAGDGKITIEVVCNDMGTGWGYKSGTFTDPTTGIVCTA